MEKEIIVENSVGCVIKGIDKKDIPGFEKAGWKVKDEWRNVLAEDNVYVSEAFRVFEMGSFTEGRMGWVW